MLLAKPLSPVLLPASGGAMDTRHSYGHGQGPGYSQVQPRLISALAANVISASSTHVCFGAHVCLHPCGENSNSNLIKGSFESEEK